MSKKSGNASPMGMPPTPKFQGDFTPTPSMRGKQRGKAKSKRQRMQRCEFCKVSFRGIRGQLFCSKQCREKAAYRRKHPIGKKNAAKPSPLIEARYCAHCKTVFWIKQRHQRFCCSSCKVLAYRARRAAAVRALQAAYGLDRSTIEDIADEMGAAKLQAILRGLGYEYDESSRQWYKSESEVQYA